MSYVHIEYLIFGTIKVLSVCDMKQHEPAFQRASKSKLDNFVSALLCAVAFMGVPTGHSTTGATFAWAVGSLGQPQFGWVWDSLRAVVNCGHKVLGGCGLKTWNNFCFLAYFFCTRFFFFVKKTSPTAKEILTQRQFHLRCGRGESENVLDASKEKVLRETSRSWWLWNGDWSNNIYTVDMYIYIYIDNMYI